MGTKLKRYNIGLKILAFAALTVLTCCMILEIQNLESIINGPISLRNLNKDYTETDAFQYEMQDVEERIATICSYKSEAAIKNGDFVDKEYVENEKSVMFDEAEEVIRQKLVNSGYEDYHITPKLMWTTFEEDYEYKIRRITSDIIDSQISEYTDAVRGLEDYPQIIFYLRMGGEILRNTDLNYGRIQRGYKHFYTGEYTDEFANGENTSLWIYAYKNEYFEEKNKELVETSKATVHFLNYCLVWSVLYLLCLVYLIYATGKKASNPKGVHLLYVDRLYNEIIMGLMVLTVYSALACTAFLGRDLSIRNITIIVLAVLTALFYKLFFMLIRHLKNKTIYTNTITYQILNKLIDLGNPMAKTMTVLTVLGLFTMIPFVGIVTVPFGIWLAYKQVVNYQILKSGVEVIKKGIYNEKILLDGNSEFAKLASDINAIASGLGEEVQRRTKSERLKTELIINVSHDIKTPLTSLITYTDLLKKEHTDNESIKKYVDVISKKTERLKVLIDDLFESTKAASGNITVNFGKVDVNALIKQGLGELDDKIKASSLDFKVNLAESAVIAWADGRLLWRVIENLLSNVLKYSMENSRVYIDTFDKDENIFIEMKNISAVELNIPEDEIMERFIRADASRSSEGSGLGLDIAKSLMICQNGELTLKVDGDLFKVTLRIGKADGDLEE